MGSAVTAIREYGLIGDTRTAALCSPWGSLDWLCLPRFDGEPVFGQLVGGPEAGCFVMGPAAEAGDVTVVRRRYRAETAVLETTWRSRSGELVLTEGMPGELGSELAPQSLLVRRLESRGGTVPARIMFDPRSGWDRGRPRIERRHGVLLCSRGALATTLQTAPELSLTPGQDTVIEVAAGRPVTVVMGVSNRLPAVYVDPEAAWRMLEADADWWTRWCADVDDSLPHRDAVVRSLLTMQLLTYSPSGAPVAAPTTSLPERVGDRLNWDYRYSWPRDAAIGISAFLHVGKAPEAQAFLYWLLHASRLTRPRLPPLLTVSGHTVPAERELAGWPGYDGSRPVRIGNAAAQQHQLDVYGWVLDAADLLDSREQPVYAETWRMLAGMADLVARTWREPDAGVWEVRLPPRHYVHSKINAWVALDRAIRMAERHGASRRRLGRWVAQREALAAQVRQRGFDEVRSTYVRAYGSSELDAALLLLPLLGLDDGRSPRVTGTIEAIRRELGAGGSLLYRYPPGGEESPHSEGAFLPCSFWLAQALAAIGRIDEAHQVFEQTLSLAGPLGLFAEQVDPGSRDHLGNYPQAMTHAALVHAALAIRDAEGGTAASAAPGRRPAQGRT